MNNWTSWEWAKLTDNTSTMVSNRMLASMLFTVLILVGGWLISAMASNISDIQQTASEARDTARSADQRSKTNARSLEDVITKVDRNAQVMSELNGVQRELNTKLETLLDRESQ